MKSIFICPMPRSCTVSQFSERYLVLMHGHMISAYGMRAVLMYPRPNTTAGMYDIRRSKKHRDRKRYVIQPPFQRIRRGLQIMGPAVCLWSVDRSAGFMTSKGGRATRVHITLWAQLIASCYCNRSRQDFLLVCLLPAASYVFRFEWVTNFTNSIVCRRQRENLRNILFWSNVVNVLERARNRKFHFGVHLSNNH
jgi:hypothetical protein